MRRVAAYIALPGRDRRLLLEAFATLVYFRLAVHVLTLERLRRWAGDLRPGEGPLDRIVWAVRTASRWLPGTTCLCSALALQRMLAHEGYASELHIGVARLEQRLTAHAWIVREGRVLIGEQEPGSFTPLAAWRAGQPTDGARELPLG